MALAALACSSSESTSDVGAGGAAIADASHDGPCRCDAGSTLDAAKGDARSENDARPGDAAGETSNSGSGGASGSAGAGGSGMNGGASGSPPDAAGGSSGAAGSSDAARDADAAGARDASLDANGGAVGAGGAGGTGGVAGTGGTAGSAGAGGAIVSCPQPDADGDGYRSIACGGNDCDDHDAAINPYAADDWDVQIVEHATFANPGYGALATAIGVTSNGAVHIVRRVDGELYDFTNETGAWVGGRVTTGPATFPVVAIDANDVVRVAFAGAEADLATRVSASTWNVTMIDGSSTIPGLAVTSNGVLHAAYMTAGQLRHASTATGSWTYEVLPTVATSGLAPTYAPSVIAIDKLGAIHVAYQERYPTGRIPSLNVESVSNASGSWVAASVGQGENVSQSIAAASAGGFHGAAVVELGIGRDTDLIYFGSAAAVLPKRIEPNIFSKPAIGVSAGRVQIAHAAQEQVNFVFHHAMRIASAPETGAAAWDHDSVEVVATSSAPSIAVDRNGAIHVAYLVQIDANGTFELHYAHRAPPDGIDQDCDGHDG